MIAKTEDTYSDGDWTTAWRPKDVAEEPAVIALQLIVIYIRKAELT